MRISTTFGQPLPDQRAHIPSASGPFRILVMGDFGGARAWHKPVTVDRDNLEEVFARLKVQVTLSARADLPETTLRLQEMDDFHPDRLYEQVELFDALRTRRQRLENDATFADESAAIVDTRQPADDVSPQTATPQQPAPQQVSSQEPPVSAQDLLSQAVEQTQVSSKPMVQQIAEGQVNIDDLVRRIVAPYVIDKADPRQAEFISGVDEAIAGTMRRLLHHPQFQQLEAAWLGLKMLIRRLETDASLQISVLHVPRKQLEQDLTGSDNLQQSGLYKLLVDETSIMGAAPWTVVVGNYTFDAAADSVTLLARIARVHAAAGTVFVAGGSPTIVGCDDLSATPDPDDWGRPDEDSAERWQVLRNLPAAASVALALPRILGRRPYGEETDPIEAFHFEEIPDGRIHSDYLWINAAFAAATLLGDSFSRGGWQLSSAWSPELSGLPVHLYSDDGESTLKPCAEAALILRAGNILGEAGLTVVHAVRGQDSALIPAVRALSATQERLAGLWH
ncbi:MAG: type VI secretion system contractile sheath large subunit [Fuerstiella sp.]